MQRGRFFPQIAVYLTLAAQLLLGVGSAGLHLLPGCGHCCSATGPGVAVASHKHVHEGECSHHAHGRPPDDDDTSGHSPEAGLVHSGSPALNTGTSTTCVAQHCAICDFFAQAVLPSAEVAPNLVALVVATPRHASTPWHSTKWRSPHSPRGPPSDSELRVAV